MRRGSVVQLALFAAVAAALGVLLALLPNWLPIAASREAGRIHFVFWFVTGICVFIFAIVAAVLGYAVWKFRRPPEDDSDGPPVLHRVQTVGADGVKAHARRWLLGQLDLGDQAAGRRIPPGELDPGRLTDQTASSVAPDEIFGP